MSGDSRTKGIGNRLAPPRFLVFLLALTAVGVFAIPRLGVPVGILAAFDAAALLFLLLCLPLLKRHTPADMRRHAEENDANRAMLLAVTAITMLAILAAIFTLSGEISGTPDKLGIIASLLLAWLFSNSVYALHYAHIHYHKGSHGGLNFAGEGKPDYSDFVYFAFTLGMTFQTSDTAVATPEMRRVVTLHCLAAFIFNLGVIAFTINVLGQR